MMQVIQFEADNVVGMRIQGKVEKPDLDQVKREVERRLSAMTEFAFTSKWRNSRA